MNSHNYHGTENQRTAPLGRGTECYCHMTQRSHIEIKQPALSLFPSEIIAKLDLTISRGPNKTP